MTRLLAALSLAFFAVAAGAQDVAPDALIKRISDEVIDIIKSDKDIKAGKLPASIDAFVHKLAPVPT